MNRLAIILVLLVCTGFAVKAQAVNPWLDSTQLNQAKAPLCIANGIIVNLTELNVDFISSMDVVKDRQINEQWSHLVDHGCIYVVADQQFDVITPRLYQQKKKLPANVRTIVFMLNGHMVSDTLRISKASIRRVDVLLGSEHPGAAADSACLSIWTLTNEERGLISSKNQLRIRGN